MDTKKNRLAVVGCGGIGEYHLNHLLTFDDIELVGFCDIRPERAEHFVSKAGRGKAYTDHRKLYDETRPDMVFICIPPDAHGDVDRDTVERGIHFFIEKPMALDLDFAESIHRQAEARGLITAVGFQCRYSDINDAAQAYIAGHRLIFVDGSRVGGVPGVEWWRVKDRSGGQLVEQTIHQLDILRMLLGEAESVYSVAGRGWITQEEWPGYDTDDCSSTLIRFTNNVTCHLMTGCYSTAGAAWDSKITFGARDNRMDYRLTESVTVYGDVAAATEAKGIIAGDGTRFGPNEENAQVVKNSQDFGTLCDWTFVEAVLKGDGSAIRSPYGDALKTLRLGLACNRSMESGKTEKV